MCKCLSFKKSKFKASMRLQLSTPLAIIANVASVLLPGLPLC